jgi:ABC-2 type transport system permease protein
VSFSLRAFRALLVANLKTFRRNPLPSSGLMLVLILLLVGVRALDSVQGQPLKLVVVDQAQTSVSARIVAALAQRPGFAITQADAGAAAARVDSGGADLEVLIPSGVGAVNSSGHLEPAQVVISYRTGGSADQAASVVAAAVDQADRLAQGVPPVLTVRRRVLNGNLRLLQLFLPGVLVFNVINAGLIVAAGVFAGYRSSGALRRIKATGIGPAELVLAHAGSNLLLAAGQVLLMLLAASFIYQTPLNVPAMLGATMLGYLVFLGLGLAVSGWVRDPQRAPVVASSIAFPLIFIGLFPPGTVGGVPGLALAALPVSLAANALREIASGSAPGTYAADLGGLALWAVAALAAAARVFRWGD